MARTKACNVDELTNGSMLRIELPDGDAVAVYRVDDEFFATADTCTHGTASLTEGDLIGDKIECPFHSGSFNCRTGQPVDAPCSIPLQCYPVVIKQGEVWIGKE